MNEKIIYNLSLLADKEKSHPFKHKAYKNAITSLENYTSEITSSSQISHLPGIGKGIQEKIDQILNNTFEPPNQENDTLKMFTNIYGVGEKKAKELIEKHSILDLLTLKSKQNEVLNDKQRIGLKYYNHLLQRIPHTEMLLHNKFINTIWMNDSHCNTFKFKYEMVGSYRRKEMTSGDIDILITFEESLNLMSRLVYVLRRNNYVIETLAEGPKKFMGICRLPNQTPRRIDIIWCSREEYPFALFYFTGSDKYNRRVREIAHKKGLKLNEKNIQYIMGEKKELPDFLTERDITDFLGLPYLEPQDRKN